MKAIAVVTPSTAPPEVRITHGDETISFSISRFGRDPFQKAGYDVFEEINRFWDDLPEDVQDRIFNIYKAIHQSYDLPYNKQELTEFLTDRATELLDIHNLQLVNDWLTFRSGITPPETYVEDYVYSVDNPTTRDKTYTRNDYRELISLSLCLRCMIPIWGEYITMDCATQDSTTVINGFTVSVNNRKFMYHKIWKTWEVHNLRTSGSDSYNGALICGDSGGAGIFKVFSGLADQDS